MKIAVWYNVPSGGAKRALHDHLTGLKRRGHQIEIWRPQVTQADYLPLSEIAPEHEIKWDLKHVDSPIYTIKMYLASRHIDRMVESLQEHSRKCADEIRRGGFDVLFANTDEQFHAPFLGRHLDMPKVLYLQEPNRPLYEALPRLPWLPRTTPPGLSFLKGLKFQGRTWIEHRHVGIRAAEEVENALHYDRILVNSRFSRESVLRAYGMNASVCYLGINPGLFTFRNLKRENYVMCVGTLFEAKNPRLILEAMGCIRKDIRCPLVWAFNNGDPELIADLQARAKVLEVDFQPRRLVPDDELVDLLNKASVFAYAPRLEPFGMAPLEANACRTPVVAVAEGGVRETVVDGENGILVEHDPESMAEGIERLLCDPELARRMGETGERMVKELWSPDAATDRLERHLERVVRERTNRKRG